MRLLFVSPLCGGCQMDRSARARLARSRSSLIHMLTEGCSLTTDTNKYGTYAYVVRTVHTKLIHRLAKGQSPTQVDGGFMYADPVIWPESVLDD